jgi:hypothetical protein
VGRAAGADVEAQIRCAFAVVSDFRLGGSGWAFGL